MYIADNKRNLEKNLRVLSAAEVMDSFRLMPIYCWTHGRKEMLAEWTCSSSNFRAVGSFLYAAINRSYLKRSYVPGLIGNWIGGKDTILSAAEIDVLPVGYIYI